jgi:hypothetical protein
VRTSIAYKGCWVRRTRTFGQHSAKTDAWFDGVMRSLEPTKPIGSQLAAKLEDLRGATLKSWMAESCTGSYPLSVIASSRTPSKGAPVDGQFLVLTIELIVDGAPWIGAAPLIVGRPTL